MVSAILRVLTSCILSCVFSETPALSIRYDQPFPCKSTSPLKNPIHVTTQVCLLLWLSWVVTRIHVSVHWFLIMPFHQYRCVDATFTRKAIACVLLHQKRGSGNGFNAIWNLVQTWKSKSFLKKFGAIWSTAVGCPENRWRTFAAMHPQWRFDWISEIALR